MRIRTILSGALALLGLVSCEKAVDALVTVDKTTIEFTKAGGSEVINFTATATWSVVGLENQQWLTVDQEAGKGSFNKQQITVSVTPNEGAQRSLTLKIQSNVFAKKSILITQAGDGTVPGVTVAEQITCAEFLEKKDANTPYILEGTISGLTNTTYKGFDLNDGTATVPCAFPENFDEKVADLKNGCVVRIQGKYNYYEKKGTHQMSNGTILEIKDGLPEADAKPSTIAEFLQKKDPNTAYILTGKIIRYTAAEKYWGIDIQDETGSITCPFPANWTDFKDLLKEGYTVTVKGKYYAYVKDGVTTDQVNNAEILSYTEGEVGPEPEIQSVTVAEFIAKADKNATYRLSGTISGFNSSFCSFDLEDETGKIYVYSVTAASKNQYASVLKNGYKVTLTGKYDFFAKDSKHEVVNASIESYEEVTVPTVEFSGTVVAVSSKGFLVKTASDGYKYVFDNDITVDVAVGDVVDVEAEATKYLELDEYEHYTVTKKGTEAVTHPEATVLTGTAFDSYNTTFGYVKFSGKLAISGNYYNVSVSGATIQGSLPNAVGVDASYNGKMIDVEGYYLQVTGSTTKYQNVLVTSLTLSADQTGADEGGSTGGGDDTPADITVGENEVLHTLTNAEIVAAGNTATSYAAHTISSTSGAWTGNCVVLSDKKWIQLRNSAGAYLTSPKFASKVSRVVIAVKVENPATSDNPRKLYAVPTVDADALLTDYPNKDKKYTLDTMAGNYGFISFNLQTLSSTPTKLEISFDGVDTDQFSLLAYSGACYIDAIYVFCEK